MNNNKQIEPLAVKTKTAWAMLDCSNTHGRELIDRGELDSYMDDSIRKITVASIHRYIERKLEAARKETSPSRTERTAKATAASIEARKAKAKAKAKIKVLEDGTSPPPANTGPTQPAE
jgi:hypothetical protein